MFNPRDLTFALPVNKFQDEPTRTLKKTRPKKKPESDQLAIIDTRARDTKKATARYVKLFKCAQKTLPAQFGGSFFAPLARKLCQEMRSRGEQCSETKIREKKQAPNDRRKKARESKRDVIAFRSWQISVKGFSLWVYSADEKGRVKTFKCWEMENKGMLALGE